MPKGTQTIEIGCSPGHPRPGDLIAGVIKETGLELRETASRSFGDWTWDYNDIPPEKWKEIQPVLEKRLCELYDNGVIRYCSW